MPDLDTRAVADAVLAASCLSPISPRIEPLAAIKTLASVAVMVPMRRHLPPTLCYLEAGFLNWKYPKPSVSNR